MDIRTSYFEHVPPAMRWQAWVADDEEIVGMGPTWDAAVRSLERQLPEPATPKQGEQLSLLGEAL